MLHEGLEKHSVLDPFSERINYLKYFLNSVWAVAFINFRILSIVSEIIASGFMKTELSPCLNLLSVD